MDANQVSFERAQQNPKIKWVWNSIVKSVNGDELVESITLKNIQTGKKAITREWRVCFYWHGSADRYFPAEVQLNPQGYIITDEKMATSLEGLFAAGDVRAKYLRQVVTAASDGAIAAVAAEKYVHETELWKNQVIKAKKQVLVSYFNPADMSGTEKIGIVDRFVRANQERFSLVKVDATRNELVGRRYHITPDQLPKLHVFMNGEIKQ